MSLIEFLWPLIRLIIFAGLGIVAVCFLYSVFKVGCDNVRNRIDDYFSDQSKLNRKKDKYINKLQKRAKREDAEAQFELAQKLFLGIDFEKNDEWALYYYEKSAENGNRDAQSTMGMFYFQGNYVEQDYEKAVSFFLKAKEQDDIIAYACLGICYEEGIVLQQDYKQAFYCYQYAANEGNDIALCRLGMLYLRGISVGKDIQQALTLLKSSAAKGNISAKKILGSIFFRGEGVEANQEVALSYYADAAKSGDDEAKYYAGYITSKKGNWQVARAYYESAAKNGYAKAENELGCIYWNALGVSRDYRKAFNYFESAAESGLPNALYNLGIMYRDGRGVPKDIFQAIHYYEEAAKSKYGAALVALGDIYLNEEKYRDLEKAEYYFKLSADTGDKKAIEKYELFKEYASMLPKMEEGDAMAQYYVGQAYYCGSFLRKNYDKAYELLTLAGNQNHAEAQWLLHVLYKNGLGVTQDKETSEKLLRLAADNGSIDAKKELIRHEKQEKKHAGYERLLDLRKKIDSRIFEENDYADAATKGRIALEFVVDAFVDRYIPGFIADKLDDKIKELVYQDIIDNHIERVMYDLKKIGNQGAHDKLVKPLSYEDIDGLTELLDELINIYKEEFSEK